MLGQFSYARKVCFIRALWSVVFDSLPSPTLYVQVTSYPLIKADEARSAVSGVDNLALTTTISVLSWCHVTVYSSESIRSPVTAATSRCLLTSHLVLTLHAASEYYDVCYTTVSQEKR